MWYLLLFILSSVGRACILEIKHSYILLRDLSHHHLYLVLDIILDMSSVKPSGTRRLATLLSCLLWDLGMIEVLLVIFMTPLSCSSASGFHGRATKCQRVCVNVCHISSSVSPPE